jgi:hypothetical protein
MTITDRPGMPGQFRCLLKKSRSEPRPEPTTDNAVTVMINNFRTIMPLLKYLVTVGLFLLVGILALSSMLGPPSDGPAFVRTAASVTVKQEGPQRQPHSNIQAAPKYQESKGNSASDGVESPNPTPVPREAPPILEAALVDHSAITASTGGMVSPRSRSVTADVMANGSEVRSAATPKKSRKVVQRKKVSPRDVHRAYLALIEPHAPFYAFAAQPPKRVFSPF